MSALWIGGCIVLAGILIGSAIDVAGKRIADAIAQRHRQWP